MKKLLIILSCIPTYTKLSATQVIETPEGFAKIENNLIILFEESECGMAPVDTLTNFYKEVSEFATNHVEPKIPKRKWCCRNFSYEEVISLYMGDTLDIGISSEIDSVVDRWLWVIPEIEKFSVWESVKYKEGKCQEKLVSVQHIMKHRGYIGANLIQIFLLVISLLFYIIPFLSVGFVKTFLENCRRKSFVLFFVALWVCLGTIVSGMISVYMLSSWLVLDSGIGEMLQMILISDNPHTQITLVYFLITVLSLGRFFYKEYKDF